MSIEEIKLDINKRFCHCERCEGVKLSIAGMCGDLDGLRDLLIKSEGKDALDDAIKIDKALTNAGSLREALLILRPHIQRLNHLLTQIESI